MSAGWDRQALLEPISPDEPCGVDLENTFTLSALEALRLFAQEVSPESAAQPPKSEDPDKEAVRKKPLPDWHGLRDDAVAALRTSKDFRVLAYLGAALLRTSDVTAFMGVLTVAAEWLERYWSQVYPRIDEDGDGTQRRSALNYLADPNAVVERVLGVTVVRSRTRGALTLQMLREIDQQRAKADGSGGSSAAEESVWAAFDEMPLEDLKALDGSVAGATRALTSIDDRMRGETGLASTFAGLAAPLATLQRILDDRLSARESVDGSTGGAPAPDRPGAGAVLDGTIRSRQDAVHALEAVADFFRRNEPSSPVPLFVDRAKRLVSKDFLEVLADIAPDALAVARSAGGLKTEQ